MNSSSFGFRAARIMSMWLRTAVPMCEEPMCTRRATKKYQASELRDFKFRCDKHAGVFYEDRKDAALIRDTEAFILEAEERPSCRSIKL